MAAKKVRWGVLGAGGIANRRTIPEGIMPAEDAELVIVMDVAASAARDVGQTYSVPFTTEVDDAWLAAARAHLEELIGGAAGGVTDPTPGEVCRRCDFARFCDAGTAWLRDNG